MRLELGKLFALICGESDSICDELDIIIITGRHSAGGLNFSQMPSYIRRFFELSVNAFDEIVRAWMSELPITNEIISFGKKIFTAVENIAGTGSAVELARRQEAEKAAGDWADPNVKTVRAASYKVWHEINRLTGLLRFQPNEEGVYIAKCEPDHFVLPAFGPHFKERFGDTPWAIIDEKRCLSLLCLEGAEPVMSGLTVLNCPVLERPSDGKWEDLWRQYHKTINNESRYNPDLQKSFMPARYWKYLPEK